MEAHERAHDEYRTAPHDVGDGAAQARQCPRVLHVEDDEELRSLCAEILRDAGFEVSGCPTVAAAQAAIEAGAPDVLLLDRDLPDGNGLDVARWVRANPVYARIPIVGFSGRKTKEEIESAIVAGFDAFLGKPCLPSMLVETLKTMVRVDPDAGRSQTGRRKKYAPGDR